MIYKCFVNIFFSLANNYRFSTISSDVENALVEIIMRMLKAGYIYNTIILGPSVVRALPLAAGINVGGHYKWHFFSLLLSLFLSSGSLIILPEGVVVGFQNLAWAPNSHKY